MIRSSLLPRLDTVFDFDGDSGPPVLSTDGTQVAFCAHTARERNFVWIQALDSYSPSRLAGTDGASFPFWSPDGKSIAFFADGKLKSVLIAGGPTSTLADAGNARGGVLGGR